LHREVALRRTTLSNETRLIERMRTMRRCNRRASSATGLLSWFARTPDVCSSRSSDHPVRRTKQRPGRSIRRLTRLQSSRISMRFGRKA
jgi:hypothetical protein